MGIPTPNDLSNLLEKPLSETKVALIPNAKDYFSERAWNYTINSQIKYLNGFGLTTEVVDLKDFTDASDLTAKLSGYDLIWAMGGNTFMLRYEMHRSGFDEAIKQLLKDGHVYGGYSAGALVAGLSINGIESADEPEFAEEVINNGIGLVPFSIFPHADDVEFSKSAPLFNRLHQDETVIELKDSQAVIFDRGGHHVVTAQE